MEGVPEPPSRGWAAGVVVLYKEERSGVKIATSIASTDDGLDEGHVRRNYEAASAQQSSGVSCDADKVSFSTTAQRSCSGDSDDDDFLGSYLSGSFVGLVEDEVDAGACETKAAAIAQSPAKAKAAKPGPPKLASPKAAARASTTATAKASSASSAEANIARCNSKTSLVRDLGQAYVVWAEVEQVQRVLSTDEGWCLSKWPSSTP